MNATLRNILISLLCPCLLCGVAQAKNEKDDKNQNAAKREQRQQANPNQGRASGGNQARKAQAARQGGGQTARKQATRPANQTGQANKKAATPQKPKQQAKAKQQQAKPKQQNRQANKNTPEKARNAGAKKQAGAAKTGTGGKNAAKSTGTAKKNVEKAARPNQKQPARTASGGKTSKPMDLPGRRPNADSKTAAGKASDKAADKKRADRATARTADKKNAKARQAKRMDLPGKRPQVKAAPARREIDRKRLDARRRMAANTRTEQIRKQGVVRPGQNTRKVRRAEFRDDRTWYASGGRRVRNDVRITNVNRVTYVNQNFRRNVNWTTSRSCWGYNPWWYRPQVRPWYGSCWNYGWRPSYYRTHYHYPRAYGPPGYSQVSVTAAVGWGLLGWSLGTMVYDYGYRSYTNPYPVQTVVVREGRNIDYSQPINRVAVETAPAEEDAVADITEQSESLVGRSQEAFREGNYLVALEQADKAIAVSPGDGALHEYRALIFFALGKYGEAAGVLNPVLASGPGWDWSTMVALYPAQDVYTRQLEKLETYSEANPESADVHFLLGYHYMVCGHLDLATPQFDRAVELMPSDSVSKQLASLTRSSDEDTAGEETVPVEEPAEDEEVPDVPPVPLEKLTGVWTSPAEGGGAITLTFREDGTFTWSYAKDGTTKEFQGEYSSNDDGMLVLDSDESQMVAEVLIPEEKEMNFMLVGGPPEDPGIDFTKG